MEFSDEVAVDPRALTHSSCINEQSEDPLWNPTNAWNSLGDAVLGLIIADDLYDAMAAQLTEGEMTALRAQLVSSNALASVLRSEMGLGQVTCGSGQGGGEVGGEG